ncbi:MAG: hypothetical protein Q7S56_03450 [Nanoarchaeota archaeon]|nr:hypothetical protein [Nanoarchaeota archaeon]
MTDIFDHAILCKKCGKEMQKGNIVRKGLILRALECPKCGDKLVHPIDEEKYDKYINLKNKQYIVKMRLVGNSYAVSIPKEIVAFMRQQEKIMNDMVKLCFEDFGRVSLRFNELNEKEIEKHAEERN